MLLSPRGPRMVVHFFYVSGDKKAGKKVAGRIDQTLTQDATGTMAYLQFEAMDHQARRSRSGRSEGRGAFYLAAVGMTCIGRARTRLARRPGSMSCKQGQRSRYLPGGSCPAGVNYPLLLATYFG